MTLNLLSVAFVQRNAGFSISDFTFNFTLNFCSHALAGNHYSNYPRFLYQNITKHREQGMIFNAISEWLSKAAYLTVRGKNLRGAHVYSILKKT